MTQLPKLPGMPGLPEPPGMPGMPESPMSPGSEMPSAPEPLGTPVLTDQQVLYHGSDQSCEACVHFDGVGSCEIVQGPKDAGGWCVAWSAGE